MSKITNSLQSAIERFSLIWSVPAGRNVRMDSQAAVGTLAFFTQANGLPFDPALVVPELSAKATLQGLLGLAEKIGLKLSAQAATKKALTAAAPKSMVLVPVKALPAAKEQLAKDVAGSAPTAPPSGAATSTDVSDESGPCVAWALIASKEGKFLVAKPGKGEPEQMSLEELVACEPQAVLTASRHRSARQEEGATAKQAFSFKWFLAEMARHRTLWVEVLSASLVIQLLAMGFPLMTQAIVDKVVVNHAQSTLIVLAIGLFVFYGFSAALSWLRQSMILRVGNTVDRVLATKVFSHLIRLPMQYFQYRPTGTLVTRMHGVETIRDFLTGAFTTMVLDVPFLLVFMVVMFYYSVPLSLITLGFVGLMAGFSFLVAPRLRELVNEQYLKGARNQSLLTEYIGAMESVKSLQMEPQIDEQYKDQMNDYLDATFKTRSLYNLYSTFMNYCEQLMGLCVLGIGAYLSMTDSSFTLGMLVAFQMFSSRVSQPLLKISGLWQEFQQTQISMKRLGDVMDVPAEPHSLVPSSRTEGAGRVEIRNLSFSYSEGLKPVYENLNLTLEPGTLTALVGPSGSGKSTIAKLLQGFYPNYKGQILIDGRDLKSLSANELRRNFGVVPQESVLFSGTIYDNLIKGNPHASFEQVIAACKMANIHEAVENLEKGYQTEIGERGAGLSGGQKQRIAIARALLKRPRVLIFDEATSSLDPESSEKVGEIVNKLKDKLCVLFITHNLPRTIVADKKIDLSCPAQ